MRRTLSFVCAICLSLTILLNNCCAEDFAFSFRNDIRFDDSMETVRSKEPSASRVEENRLWVTRVALSGIDDSIISYEFEYDKLKIIQLNYGDKKLDDALKSYDIIDEGLKRKYGEPVKDVENTITYNGGVIELQKKWGDDNTKISNKTLNAKNQWVIKIGEDYQIVIEHILFNYEYKQYENSEPEIRPYHAISYQYLREGVKPTDFIDKDL